VVHTGFVQLVNLKCESINSFVHHDKPLLLLVLVAAGSRSTSSSWMVGSK
jgi:hypothetical protein